MPKMSKKVLLKDLTLNEYAYFSIVMSEFFPEDMSQLSHNDIEKILMDNWQYITSESGCGYTDWKKQDIPLFAKYIFELGWFDVDFDKLDEMLCDGTPLSANLLAVTTK